MNHQTRLLSLIALVLIPTSVACDDESSQSLPDVAVPTGDQHDVAVDAAHDAQAVDAFVPSTDSLLPTDGIAMDAPSAKRFDIDFSWGMGSPFIGKTQTPCGEITLDSTETEAWSEIYFRDNTSGPAATVRFGLVGGFTQVSILIERMNIDEKLTTFRPLPNAVDMDLSLADGAVTTTRGDDFASGHMRWNNPGSSVEFTIDAPAGALALTRISGECGP